MNDRPHNLDYERPTTLAPDWWERNWPVLVGVSFSAGALAIMGPIMALIGVVSLLVPSVVIPWYWRGTTTPIEQWLLVITWLVAGVAAIAFLGWRFRRWRSLAPRNDARS